MVTSTERDPQDLRVVRETEAAADEAGGGGGRAPTDEDPARRPVDEGGGQAEGFERAGAAGARRPGRARA